MGGVNGCAKRNIHSSGTEAVLKSALLLRGCQQVLDVNLRGLFVRRCYPIPIHDANRMIAPEGAFFGVDGDNRELKVLVVRLDDHALVEYGGREELRTGGKHLASEESG